MVHKPTDQDVWANRLLVELDGGRTFLLNMTDKIETIRFNDLKDEFLFMSATTDGNSILWDNGRISLSISEIFDMTRVNRPQMQQRRII